MKVFIRKELDVNQPINLRRLSPFMKIYAGLLTKIHSTKLYKTNLQKRLEEDYLQQVKQDENLKDALLAVLYRELSTNNTLKEKGEVCSELIVQIQRDQQESLKRIMSHKDFLIYNMTLIEENSDILKAFKNIPILLKVTKKTI